jgi:hypothetical protein
MFLSKRTIDCHLRNVFVKLGIASRTQLAGLRLSDPGTDDHPRVNLLRPQRQSTRATPS